MRKLLSILFALLLVFGVASNVLAVSIPTVEDPSAGPAVWLVPVYNNSGSTLDVGDVVVWDIGSSTGDNDNYVTTTTTQDTYLVAGVVYGSDIAAADKGNIVVRGVTQVDFDSTNSTGAAGSILCTSGTAGSARNCSSLGWGGFGIVTTAVSSSSVNAFINVQ